MNKAVAKCTGISQQMNTNIKVPPKRFKTARHT